MKMSSYIKKFTSIFRLRNILLLGLFGLLVGIGLELQDSYRKHGKFRTMQDPIVLTEKVNLSGLRELHAAGGPALPLAEVKKRLGNLNGQLIIVDGRRSRHGYINGIPTTYFGYLQEAPPWKAYLWRLFYTGTFQPQPEKVVPPFTEARNHGFGYANFEIGSKYTSSDAAVEGFVNFFDGLPKDALVYFHCHHGKGRTSMMLVMWDIMANAPKVSLKDIVKRQYLLGSVNLFDTAAWAKGTYSTKKLEERKKFIVNFYAFISQRKAGGIQNWSEWNYQK